ncbi:MAG: DNA-binding protein [Candidatus Binatia bacterium]
MKHPLLSIIVGIAAMAAVTYATDTNQPAAQAPAPAGAPSHGHSGDGTVPGGNAGTSITGKVVETMNAGTYTYVQVDDGTKKIWAAAPQFQVAVGDVVVVPEGAPMRNFESKTLGRTFDLVYFVEGIQVAGSHTAKEQVAAAHGAGTTKAPAVALDLSNIAKATGGQTVSELFANKTALAGKEVAVRGKVAKFTSSIMGKNWIHLKDGTGSAGTNDLTVTTNAEAAVGNTVLVHGKLSTDKDFGFGYKYDVLIEDAAVAVE